MAMLIAACVLTGCGGGKPTNSLTSTPARVASTSPSAAASSSPAPAMTDTQRLIVARYRLFWSTVEQVEATNDVNSAALRDVATGSQFTTLVENMIKDSGTGTTHRGTVALNPRVPVVASDGLSATLYDCQDGSKFLPYRNGQLAGKGVPRNDGVTATLWLVDGVWKVAGTVFTVGRCDE